MALCILTFDVLNAEGAYEVRVADEHGNYQTPLLPGLRVHVPTLWEPTLPGYYEIGDRVRRMLDDE